MGRKAGEKPFQISMSPKAMTALEMAASLHKDDVDRDRAMQKGPMVAYVARWFANLSRRNQLEVILEGKRLVDSDTPGAEIPPFGDIEIFAVSEAERRNLIEPGRRAVESKNLPSSVWEYVPGRTSGAEPASRVSDRLKGDEGAVGKRSRAPKRK